MESYPYTHIVYLEALVDGKKKRKLIARLRSKLAAFEALDSILNEERRKGAHFSGDELRIVKDGKIIKRWVIERIAKEEELNLSVPG